MECWEYIAIRCNDVALCSKKCNMYVKAQQADKMRSFHVFVVAVACYGIESLASTWACGKSPLFLHLHNG